jgi:hypothetical protein
VDGQEGADNQAEGQEVDQEVHPSMMAMDDPRWNVIRAGRRLASQPLGSRASARLTNVSAGPTVRRVPGARRSPGLLGSLPALGGLAVGLVVLGPVGAAVTVGLTVAVLALVLRAYPAHYRRTRTLRAQPSARLVAEASEDGRPGLLTFRPEAIEWTTRSGDGEPIPRTGTEQIELQPKRSRLIQATSMSVHLSDGSTRHLTVTAPVESIEAALADW